ncbi:GtrA family protein [Peribacillus asahii]|uniref:GtrA family protein n=1 Tax=Peribacillus asahii TaxID=228899 RepID=UPI000FDBC5ED|nr:GtrA family protein [Peribacillus asahii]USK86938.1 GtrA family protein [Peribacillus asahii]
MKVIGREFIKFIVVGIINTFNYYIVYLFLHAILETDYMMAHIVGFITSLVISFFLNSYFTFKVKPTLDKFLKFPLTQLVNIALSSLFLYVFVKHIRINSTIAPVLSIFITVPLTFVITRKILKK